MEHCRAIVWGFCLGGQKFRRLYKISGIKKKIGKFWGEEWGVGQVPPLCIYCVHIPFRINMINLLILLLNISVNDPDFKAGVTSLSMLLQVPPHTDHLELLKVTKMNLFYNVMLLCVKTIAGTLYNFGDT